MGEKKIKSFNQLFAEAKKRDAYWVADAIFSFTEQLHQLAEAKQLSRADLARLLGVSPAYITKIFRGNVNFTIDTMVRLARRVGARLQLTLVPEMEAFSANWDLVATEAYKAVEFEAADTYRYDTDWGTAIVEVGDELLAACG